MPRHGPGARHPRAHHLASTDQSSNGLLVLALPVALAADLPLGLPEQRLDRAVLIVEALQALLQDRDGLLRAAGAYERGAEVVHGVGARVDLRGAAAGAHGGLEVV